MASALWTPPTRTLGAGQNAEFVSVLVTGTLLADQTEGSQGSGAQATIPGPWSGVCGDAQPIALLTVYPSPEPKDGTRTGGTYALAMARFRRPESDASS